MSKCVLKYMFTAELFSFLPVNGLCLLLKGFSASVFHSVSQKKPSKDQSPQGNLIWLPSIPDVIALTHIVYSRSQQKTVEEV